MKPANFLTTASLLLAVFLVSACSSTPKSYVALLPDADGKVGKVLVQGEHGQQLLEKEGDAAFLDGTLPAEPISREQLERDFASAWRSLPLLPEHFLLYFKTGGAQLTEESQALLPQVIESIARRPAVDVSIIGHTDTVGDAELNARLALKRAKLIADILREQGLQLQHLSIDSHGEGNLLKPTPDETPEPKNRRVEISIR